MTAQLCIHDLPEGQCADCAGVSALLFGKPGSGRPPLYDWASLVGDLFDLLPTEAPGATLAEISQRLEVPDDVARQLIGRLRELLGDSHDANVIVEPGTWDYRLEGDLANARAWQIFRLRGLVTMLDRVHAVTRSLARGTQADERVGREARLFERLAGRLHEDATGLLTELEQINGN
jgi:hypothetical protein